jgi:hypothetical protein
VQSERGRQRLGVVERRPESRRRLVHHDPGSSARLLDDFDVEDVGADLLPHHPRRLVADLTGRGQPQPCAQRVVARAVDFRADRGERAQPPVDASFRRPYEERRLGLVELPGDGPHLLDGEVVGVRHQRQRVAGQRPLGEHVHEEEPNGARRRGHGVGASFDDSQERAST